MDSTARLPQNPAARFTGIGLAVAVHVVVILALSQGLMNTTKPKPAEAPIVVLKDEPKPLPLPVPPPKPTVIKLDDPTLPVIPTPVFKESEPALTNPPTIRPLEGTDTRPVGPVLAQADPVPVPHNGPQPVNAVCTKTMAPTMPATNFSGDAVFRVIAGTHAGHVNSVEIQAVSGGMDMRSQRAFKAAIESALREGYECASDVRFTQEFHFRVE
ncbi:MAG TPA: hypothetical protein VGM81_13360 [Burkholderiaceae bacterium]